MIHSDSHGRAAAIALWTLPIQELSFGGRQCELCMIYSPMYFFMCSMGIS